MKKNKLEKIQSNIEKNLKEVLNDINELIQNAKRNNWAEPVFTSCSSPSYCC